MIEKRNIHGKQVHLSSISHSADFMTFKKRIRCLISCILLVLGTNTSAQEGFELKPGNTGSSNTTEFNHAQSTATYEERRIGAAWLKQYRRRAPISTDPAINEYVEQLLNKLVTNSGIKNPKLSVVVTRNRSLNAFAVPGEVIGVHTGLFNYAKTEQQLASVLAHELAHLRQRHYARSVEKQKQQSITTMAALLASLVIVANTDGDEGGAALSATQAYAIDQRLRFSRAFEREADSIGMEIMVKSNMDPHAMEGMFGQMERISRFSPTPPEFLLTHPLTNRRIVDAINIARKYKKQAFPENPHYQFVRARAILASEKSPQQAIERFRGELSGFDTSLDGSRYGLALALTNNRQFKAAQEVIDELIKKHPSNALLTITLSDTLAGQGRTQEAINLVLAEQQKKPNYFPLTLQLSELYRLQKKYDSAKELLNTLSSQRSEDPFIWHELAEVSGLADDILLLHKARAEYFILHGDFANAEQQLNELENKTKNNSELKRYATQRLGELNTLRQLAKL